MTDIIDEKEYEQTMAEAKKKLGDRLNTLMVEFKQPREWEGQTYDSLTFDWAKLTGEDFLAIEQLMILQGKAIVSAEFSTEFILQMAVRACREQVDIRFLRKLPIGLFNKIRNGARDFLTVAQA